MARIRQRNYEWMHHVQQMPGITFEFHCLLLDGVPLQSVELVARMLTPAWCPQLN